jgi:hypothetical protein
MGLKKMRRKDSTAERRNIVKKMSDREGSVSVHNFARIPRDSAGNMEQLGR